MVASSDSPISRQPMCIALLCTHAMEMMILLKTSSIPTRTNMLDVSAEEPNMYEPIRGTAATGTGVPDIPCQDTSRLGHCQHPQHWEVIRTIRIPAADIVKAMAAMLWIETPNATLGSLDMLIGLGNSSGVQRHGQWTWTKECGAIRESGLHPRSLTPDTKKQMQNDDVHGCSTLTTRRHCPVTISMSIFRAVFDPFAIVCLALLPHKRCFLNLAPTRAVFWQCPGVSTLSRDLKALCQLARSRQYGTRDQRFILCTSGASGRVTGATTRRQLRHQQ